MKKLLKTYWLVPCVFIVVLVAVVIGSMLLTTDSATATLELSYENASKSQNIDGSHFSVLDFKSDAFLQRVAENLSTSGHDVSGDDIGQWFSVAPCGSYSEAYTATTYVISAQTPVQSEVSSQEMVDAVVKAYQQQYTEQTSVNVDLLKIDSEYLESLEYTDIYDYLLMKSKLFQDMVNEWCWQRCCWLRPALFLRSLSDGYWISALTMAISWVMADRKKRRKRL